jgi:hypothetical protein
MEHASGARMTTFGEARVEGGRLGPSPFRERDVGGVEDVESWRWMR